MAAARRYTRGVTAAVHQRRKPESEEFGRLRPGDEFKVVGKRGSFRFLSVTLVAGEPGWVNAIGPLGQRQNMKSIRPDDVKMPSARALNSQRARRVAS